MFNFKNACCTTGNNRKLKIAENASVMYVINNQRKGYHDIQIDGCDITEGYKCDRGVYLVETNAGLLVELKGSDVAHAVEQLAESLGKYKSKLSQLGASVQCFVISCNNPLSSTASQNVKIKFKKKHGVSLRIERSNFSYEYT